MTFLCRGWAQHLADRLRDSVSSGPSLSSSDNVDLLSSDISLDSFTAVLINLPAA